jgi:hypothetical protein
MRLQSIPLTVHSGTQGTRSCSLVMLLRYCYCYCDCSLNDSAGLPPSSTHSFLLANRNIPSVVITDHADTYANPYSFCRSYCLSLFLSLALFCVHHSWCRYYDSEFDDWSNISPVLVCQAATLIARYLCFFVFFVFVCL